MSVKKRKPAFLSFKFLFLTIIAVSLLLGGSFIFIALSAEGKAPLQAEAPPDASSKPVGTGPQEEPSPEKELSPPVILITLDKVTFSDLLNFGGPVLSSFLEKSGVALMNINTASAPGTESGYLTIGAGARLSANWTARRAFNRNERWHDEEAEALYRRHTGSAFVPPGEVLHLYSGVLRRLNEKLTYPFLVGALGEALARSGRGVAVLGNADGDTPNRQVATIAMDSKGIVKYGDVSASLCKEKEYFPFGRGSDAEAYLGAFETFFEEVSLIVVEWGDTSRIDDYMAHLPSERRGELLRASFLELDRFLLGIRPYLERGSRLFLLAPSLPTQSYSGGERLAPVIFYGPGSFGESEGGLLFSATTRRPGLIANIDIAPAILTLLDVQSPVFFYGAPIKVFPAANHLENLAAFSQRVVRIYEQRPSIIKGYLLLQIILLPAALGGVILRFKPLKILRPGLYALLFFPAAALLAPAFYFYPCSSLYLNSLFLAVLTAILTLLAVFLFPELPAFFAFSGGVNFCLLTADLFRGAPFMSSSFLGYDPVGGARFYGIGNEYMGIMVGSLLLCAGSLLTVVLNKDFREQKGKKAQPKKAASTLFRQNKAAAGLLWGFIFLSFFVIFLMSSPMYGANFGGAVTAGAALGATVSGLISLFKWKGYALFPFWGSGFKRTAIGCGKTFPFHPLQQKALLFLIFVLATAAMLYFLNNLGGHPGADTVETVDTAVSHLGRTLELVSKNGPQELLNIARRKMEMNMKLLRHSLWSRLLFVFIFLITALYFYPVGLTKKIFQNKPAFKVAFGGIAVGSLVSFFVNDSGVVAAATTMLYGGVPLLIFCFREVFS